MIIDLDTSENLYFSIDNKNKKYVKYLTNYTYALMDKHRIVESCYYFNILYSIKPKSKIANILGYKIAIRTFDSEAVQKFNKFLWDAGYDKQELLCLRLEYYYAINNNVEFERLSEGLLDSFTLKKEFLIIVMELILGQKNNNLVSCLYRYLQKNKLKPSADFDVRAKEMVLQKLVDTLSEMAK